jgi:hypothetical protein
MLGPIKSKVEDYIASVRVPFPELTFQELPLEVPRTYVRAGVADESLIIEDLPRIPTIAKSLDWDFEMLLNVLQEAVQIFIFYERIEEPQLHAALAVFSDDSAQELKGG